MKVCKLTVNDTDAVKSLFFNHNMFMGVGINNHAVGDETSRERQELLFNNFTCTYLSELKSYYAYGYFNDDNELLALIGYYMSNDDASWYWTQVRTKGNNSKEIKVVLDKVMEVNEWRGLNKFYSMFPLRYRDTYRRLAFSTKARERYDYFDEFYVEDKHQPIFNLPWQILYNRVLVPVDTIVRCTFLKQKYRETLFNGGNL